MPRIPFTPEDLYKALDASKAPPKGFETVMYDEEKHKAHTWDDTKGESKQHGTVSCAVFQGVDIFHHEYEGMEFNTGKDPNKHNRMLVLKAATVAVQIDFSFHGGVTFFAIFSGDKTDDKDPDYRIPDTWLFSSNFKGERFGLITRLSLNTKVSFKQDCFEMVFTSIDQRRQMMAIWALQSEKFPQYLPALKGSEIKKIYNTFDWEEEEKIHYTMTEITCLDMMDFCGAIKEEDTKDK